MKVKIRYFASLREKVGNSEEELVINSGDNLAQIYLNLALKYGFNLTANEIKFSVNNEYVEKSFCLKENDVIVFIPPVAGG